MLLLLKNLALLLVISLNTSISEHAFGNPHAVASKTICPKVSHVDGTTCKS